MAAEIRRRPGTALVHPMRTNRLQRISLPGRISCGRPWVAELRIHLGAALTSASGWLLFRGLRQSREPRRRGLRWPGAACAAIFGCGTATGTTAPFPSPWNTNRPSPTFPAAADHTTAPERQREGLRNQRFAAMRRFERTGADDVSAACACGQCETLRGCGWGLAHQRLLFSVETRLGLSILILLVALKVREFCYLRFGRVEWAWRFLTHGKSQHLHR